MEYRCTLLAITRLPATSRQVVMPLCNTCKRLDCTNNVERVGVSICGITKKCRCYARGKEIFFVVECNGYTTNESVEEDENDEDGRE